MEIGTEPHYPTPCMLLTANTGVSESGIQRKAAISPSLSLSTYAHARAREIIELFGLGNNKWVIGALIAATLSDCRSVSEFLNRLL
jgi:hypothetical protein